MIIKDFVGESRYVTSTIKKIEQNVTYVILVLKFIIMRKIEKKFFEYYVYLCERMFLYKEKLQDRASLFNFATMKKYTTNKKLFM